MEDNKSNAGSRHTHERPHENMQGQHGESHGHRGGHRDGHRNGHRGGHRGSPGAQTYRRGRILSFLEQLQLKRATLTRQLGEEKFQPIHAVISGELKAIEQVIEEFVHLFDLSEAGQETEN